MKITYTVLIYDTLVLSYGTEPILVAFEVPFKSFHRGFTWVLKGFGIYWKKKGFRTVFRGRNLM